MLCHMTAGVSPGTAHMAQAPKRPERHEATADSVSVLQPPLTGPQLSERVTRSSPALLKELYDIARRQIVTEAGRQTRLDSKATSLLTAAGLSLTVAFTFGGQMIIGHRSPIDPAHVPIWAQTAFAVGVIFGLAAACFAIGALFVRGSYLTVNERSIFSEAALKAAEDAYDPATPGSDVVGMSEYHKALIPHLWCISQKHASVHETKATLIKVGQGLFLAFLMSLFIVFLSLLSGFG